MGIRPPIISGINLKRYHISPILLLVLIQSLVGLHMTNDVLICHLGKTKYNPWHNRLMVVNLWVVTMAFVADLLVGHDSMNIVCPLYAVLGFNVVAITHTILYLIVEIANSVQLKTIFCVNNKVINKPDLYVSINSDGIDIE